LKRKIKTPKNPWLDVNFGKKLKNIFKRIYLTFGIAPSFMGNHLYNTGGGKPKRKEGEERNG
jgi:hypothetical protein